MDLGNAASVRSAVSSSRPEGLIHLAGLSSVGESHKDPPRAYAVNTQGTVALLEALRSEAPRCRVILVSSGEVYGPVAPGARADEAHPLHPNSPYAGSKLSAEIAGLQFFRSYGLPVVLARPFNHLGKGQRPSFVVPSFARQIASIAQGKQPPLLRTGDLSPIRDFSHVDDVTFAYRLLLEKGEAGRAYNICSGEGRSVRQILDELLSIAQVKATVETDPEKLRKTELPSLVGDPTALEKLGWRRQKNVRAALAEALAEATSQ